MTISEMQARKQELGYSLRKISELSGVPFGTVMKVFSGATGNPRQATVEALERVLRPENHPNADAPAPAAADASSDHVTMVREPLPAYGDPQDGGYTIDDYYALPDDRRVELIDGVFYDMAAPTAVHQVILVQLTVQFNECVEQHPNCELFIAPFDVRLDNDNRTMVQPDLLIVCDRQGLDRRRMNGAPDFILEILSPSTRTNDLFRKLNKYRFAGVQEYWVVDPDRLKVLQYDFREDKIPEQYTFQDTVPVLISDGECSIDFKKIFRKIEKYLPEDPGSLT